MKRGRSPAYHGTEASNSLRPLSTRQITLTGLLAALAMALGATGLGYIPVPTPGQALTIMQIPAIVAGLVAGPVSGAVVGGLFGAFSLMRGYAPPDPLVQLVPRALIGVVAWAVYVRLLGLRPGRWRRAATAAAAVASLFHTTAVLGLVVLLGYFPPQAALVTWVVHGPLEAVVAVALTVPAVSAARRLRIALLPGEPAPERIR